MDSSTASKGLKTAQDALTVLKATTAKGLDFLSQLGSAMLGTTVQEEPRHLSRTLQQQATTLLKAVWLKCLVQEVPSTLTQRPLSALTVKKGSTVQAQR
jgi:hypothetical protein